MTQTPEKLRNIALVAHVDHGKTTLLDALLRSAGTFAAHSAIIDRVMDNDDVDKELRPAVGLITAWMSELARTHHIDATLLGTRNDILSLLRKNPQGRLSVGWRAEMVGKDIERILSGEAGLSFNGHGRLRLLPTNNPTI